MIYERFFGLGINEFTNRILANNPDTLGAELIEQHEAIQAMKKLIAEKPGMSKIDQKKSNARNNAVL